MTVLEWDHNHSGTEGTIQQRTAYIPKLSKQEAKPWTRPVQPQNSNPV